MRFASFYILDAAARRKVEMRIQRGVPQHMHTDARRETTEKVKVGSMTSRGRKHLETRYRNDIKTRQPLHRQLHSLSLCTASSKCAGQIISWRGNVRGCHLIDTI